LSTSSGSLPSRLTRASVALAVVLGACGPVTPADLSPENFVPPTPLSVVAIASPLPARLVDACRLLEAVVQAAATPSETLVLRATSSFGDTYTVRRGDTLDSIARAHGVPLARLEAANPQLGPVGGRDWNRIHADERVTLPRDGTADIPPNLVVTRAPAGPPPPALVRLPPQPPNPTSFQEAQYRQRLAAAKATNQARIAAWDAAAARDVAPWQSAVIAQLRALAAAPPTSDTRTTDLAGAVMAAVTTLDELSGRRLLLMLDPGEAAPSDVLPRQVSLAGIHLVLAGLSDSPTAEAWARSARTAGASVSLLDPALTQLQLPSVING
jgi:LysM domain